jgi:hypothetical protein
MMLQIKEYLKRALGNGRSVSLVECCPTYYEIDCVNNIIMFTKERPALGQVITPAWALRKKKFKDKKIIKNVITGTHGVLTYNLMSFENTIIDEEFVSYLKTLESTYVAMNNPWKQVLLKCAEQAVPLEMFLELLEKEEKVELQIANRHFVDSLAETKCQLNSWLVNRYSPIKEWLVTLSDSSVNSLEKPL